ncbi:four-carbon acid sugar kinase family protein [Spelaeicoccus albus]|uniref:Uncharacterized protein YgbK (DUF1537 family) n=1 Tax=Spelaeicoccus albus TaxID=1280376 RepID=A0A7Z0AA56_9MICO|nr:four-carbon acid sugar kinase family protein [Spelaeicoccus albus]NYI67252.1 uncharacterized protein YgbK (DUF1537 family) [Spelaeicoccus albus]
MTAMPDDTPVLTIPDAAQLIRAANKSSGRRIALLDDDPTGSQTVHDVDVVMALDAVEYRRALAEPGSECFILTNTRALDESDAVALSTAVADDVYSVALELNVPLSLVSRSDSTLRGHVIAEMDALTRSATRAGRPLDAVLFAPAFFEAGRFTAGNVHYARVGDDVLPVGETEFARDATFGYTASDLREFLAEKSAGRIAVDDVASLSLDDIRVGGPDRVAEVLAGTRDAQPVVVNAACYQDLEVVVLGVIEAEQRGKRVGYRAGPSLARPLAGLDAKAPLTASDIRTNSPAGNGLVVVGSHVGLTSRQVEAARRRLGLTEHELDAERLLSDDAATYIDDAASAVRESLAAGHTLIYTSRTLIRGIDEQDSLRIARTVSAGVNAVVRAAMVARPGWVIAKGGITSHEVAVSGLGIRRARVLGQLFEGIVSVLNPTAAGDDAVGVPYVVFAGNVGNEETLADAIEIMSGS